MSPGLSAEQADLQHHLQQQLHQQLLQQQQQPGLPALLAATGSPVRIDVAHHVHGRVELGITYSVGGSPAAHPQPGSPSSTTGGTGTAVPTAAGAATDLAAALAAAAAGTGGSAGTQHTVHTVWGWQQQEAHQQEQTHWPADQQPLRASTSGEGMAVEPSFGPPLMADTTANAPAQVSQGSAFSLDGPLPSSAAASNATAIPSGLACVRTGGPALLGQVAHPAEGHLPAAATGSEQFAAGSAGSTADSSSVEHGRRQRQRWQVPALACSSPDGDVPGVIRSGAVRADHAAEPPSRHGTPVALETPPRSPTSLDVLRSVGERVQHLLEALGRQNSGSSRQGSRSPRATMQLHVFQGPTTAAGAPPIPRATSSSGGSSSVASTQAASSAGGAQVLSSVGAQEQHLLQPQQQQDQQPPASSQDAQPAQEQQQGMLQQHQQQAAAVVGSSPVQGDTYGDPSTDGGTQQQVMAQPTSSAADIGQQGRALQLTGSQASTTPAEQQQQQLLQQQQQHTDGAQSCAAGVCVPQAPPASHTEALSMQHLPLPLPTVQAQQQPEQLYPSEAQHAVQQGTSTGEVGPMQEVTELQLYLHHQELRALQQLQVSQASTGSASSQQGVAQFAGVDAAQPRAVELLQEQQSTQHLLLQQQQQQNAGLLAALTPSAAGIEDTSTAPGPHQQEQQWAAAAAPYGASLFQQQQLNLEQAELQELEQQQQLCLELGLMPSTAAETSCQNRGQQHQQEQQQQQHGVDLQSAGLGTAASGLSHGAYSAALGADADHHPAAQSHSSSGQGMADDDLQHLTVTDAANVGEAAAAAGSRATQMEAVGPSSPGERPSPASVSAAGCQPVHSSPVADAAGDAGADAAAYGAAASEASALEAADGAALANCDPVACTTQKQQDEEEEQQQQQHHLQDQWPGSAVLAEDMGVCKAEQEQQQLPQVPSGCELPLVPAEPWETPALQQSSPAADPQGHHQQLPPKELHVAVSTAEHLSRDSPLQQHLEEVLHEHWQQQQQQQQHTLSEQQALQLMQEAQLQSQYLEPQPPTQQQQQQQSSSVLSNVAAEGAAMPEHNGAAAAATNHRPSPGVQVPQHWQQQQQQQHGQEQQPPDKQGSFKADSRPLHIDLQQHNFQAPSQQQDLEVASAKVAAAPHPSPAAAAAAAALLQSQREAASVGVKAFSLQYNSLFQPTAEGSGVEPVSSGPSASSTETWGTAAPAVHAGSIVPASSGATATAQAAGLTRVDKALEKLQSLRSTLRNINSSSSVGPTSRPLSAGPSQSSTRTASLQLPPADVASVAPLAAHSCGELLQSKSAHAIVPVMSGAAAVAGAASIPPSAGSALASAKDWIRDITERLQQVGPSGVQEPAPPPAAALLLGTAPEGVMAPYAAAAPEAGHQAAFGQYSSSTLSIADPVPPGTAAAAGASADSPVHDMGHAAAAAAGPAEGSLHGAVGSTPASLPQLAAQLTTPSAGGQGTPAPVQHAAVHMQLAGSDDEMLQPAPVTEPDEVQGEQQPRLHMASPSSAAWSTLTAGPSSLSSEQLVNLIEQQLQHGLEPGAAAVGVMEGAAGAAEAGAASSTHQSLSAGEPVTSDAAQAGMQQEGLQGEEGQASPPAEAGEPQAVSHEASMVLAESHQRLQHMLSEDDGTMLLMSFALKLDRLGRKFRPHGEVSAAELRAVVFLACCHGGCCWSKSSAHRA